MNRRYYPWVLVTAIAIVWVATALAQSNSWCIGNFCIVATDTRSVNSGDLLTIQQADARYARIGSPTPSPTATPSPTPTPGPSPSPTATPVASPTPSARYTINVVVTRIDNTVGSGVMVRLIDGTTALDQQTNPQGKTSFTVTNGRPYTVLISQAGTNSTPGSAVISATHSGDAVITFQICNAQFCSDGPVLEVP